MVRLRRSLDEGMRLFHAGDRAHAVPSLEAVLSSPVHVASFRLAAAGLLAETYRGMAEFVRAQQYYELAITESEAISAQERVGNEWYVHYRPRVQLGLITALRRSLDPDHERIQELLRFARERFTSLRVPDLMAQLNAVEGLYCRQMGDLSGAADRLSEAREALKGVNPPFTFLLPDHIEALLVQVHVLTPGARVRVGLSARRLLRAADAGTWSKAVAAIGMLHVLLNRLLSEGAEPSTIRDALASTQREDGAGYLFSVLDANAELEGDPLLTTEALVLRTAWLGAARRASELDRLMVELAFCLDRLPQPMVLLRSVEASMAFDAFGEEGQRPWPALESVRFFGRKALAELTGKLGSYSRRPHPAWHEHLSAERAARGHHQLEWLGDALSSLRMAAWP